MKFIYSSIPCSGLWPPTPKHIPAPVVAQIPMLVVHELEIRQGELFLHKFRKFVQDWLGPVAYIDFKLVGIPDNSSSKNRVITDLGRRLNYLKAFRSRILNHLRRDLPLAHIEQGFLCRIERERAHRRHRHIEGFHICHQGGLVFIVELYHTIFEIPGQAGND